MDFALMYTPDYKYVFFNRLIGLSEADNGLINRM